MRRATSAEPGARSVSPQSRQREHDWIPRPADHLPVAAGDRLPNREFGQSVALARDGGRVEVDPRPTGIKNLTAVVAKIENVTVSVHRRARVVVVIASSRPSSKFFMPLTYKA
jgi:hypothetical protein